MITLKGPEIHFWIPEEKADRKKKKATNLEAEKCTCTGKPADQADFEEHQQRVLPSYFHVEIF
jgi:hypothetical protein